MDKTEYRAVIKFLVLEGQSSKQVEEGLTSVYGQSSPSSSTIKRWVKEFQRGRESLEDDPRSGRPTTSTSPENIEKVHKLVIENRRISLYELEEATGISYGSIHNILHDEPHMSKVCARWVPKMLSDDMKQSRVTISGAMLTRYNTNPDDFHFRVGRPRAGWGPPVIFIAGRPKAALLFWFFGDFRCGALLFMVIHVIYKYKNK